jgi:hypothetical protein
MGLTMLVALVVVVILVVIALDLFGVGWALRKLWQGRRGRHGPR